MENFDSSLINNDLAPVPKEKQTWTAWNYITLWVGMCICIPSYMIASSLIDGGMSVLQAILTVLLGNTIVLFPMILNGHVGVKYGIPFPIYARLSFGTRGANVPALLRAIVACGWFGIQCWIGGSALMTMLSIIWPGAVSFPSILPAKFGVSLIPFLCFIFFWSINVFFIFKGIEAIKVLEGFCAPILLISGLVLLAWAFKNAHGLGILLLSHSKFETPKSFFSFFFPALTGIIGYWATLSLNIPDFTRYAKDQKAQIVGQAVGLPPTMTFIAFIGVAVTMATFIIYGQYIWNPIALISKFENKAIVFIAMGIICLATIAMNAAANIVAPANDFSNLSPSKIDFKRGGIITAIIGILIMPWKLIADPNGYIFTWLIGYSALLGPVTGILLTDYFFIKKTKISVDDLYRIHGKYSYKEGFNIKALIALACGILPNIPGFLIQINALNKDSFPAFVTDLYHYAWFIGLALASISYYILMISERENNHA